MEHSFNVELAKIVGIEGAIIYKSICFWVEKNKANNHSFIDGEYWTYNSWKAWRELFPYIKIYTIKSALKKLKDNGLITWKVGINPLNKWDKTAYYRPLNNSNSDSGKNQSSEIDKVNDEYYTDIKPDSKHIKEDKNKDSIEIYEYYMKQLKASSNKQQSINNIQTWLKSFSKEELLNAIDNYIPRAKQQKDKKYIKDCKNFFGVAKESNGFFKDFLVKVKSEPIMPNGNKIPSYMM